MLIGLKAMLWKTVGDSICDKQMLHFMFFENTVSKHANVALKKISILCF
jgi:hypothetical protein